MGEMLLDDCTYDYEAAKSTAVELGAVVVARGGSTKAILRQLLGDHHA